MRLIRSYAYLLFLCLSTTVIGLLGVPFMAYRPAAWQVAKLWARSNLCAARWLCGVRSEVTGREHFETSPAIIAAKHQSMWETLALTVELPRGAIVLKKELKSIPMFGWWCQAVGFIFVDRDAGAKALRSMLTEAKTALKDGASHIVIFPEGTRAAPGSHAPYQPGIAALAKSLNLPVVPVAHNSGSYWLTPGPEKIPGTIKMEVFPPLPAGLDRAALTEELERTVENAVRRLEAEAPRGQAGSNPPVSEGLPRHEH